jgi:hypothetical protein
MELVQKLAEWGTSDVFADALDAWMNERCTIFDRASNEDGSQPLDWGAAFAQYNDWLDSQLAKFCESVGAGAEEVSAAIAKSLEVGGSIARVCTLSAQRSASPAGRQGNRILPGIHALYRIRRVPRADAETGAKDEVACNFAYEKFLRRGDQAVQHQRRVESGQIKI